MKKAVLILALLALIVAGLVLFGTEKRVQTVAPESIAEDTVPKADGAASEAIYSENSAAMWQDENLLLSISYNGMTLPVNEDGTVLIPVIPESGVTVTCDKGAMVTRSESITKGTSGTFRSVTITVRKGKAFRTVTLAETHMAVAQLELNIRGIGKDSDPVRDEKRKGTLHLFSIDEAGGLRYETSAVSVKLRGASSRGYKKKSYTLTNIDAAGNPFARSLMGLTADEKFGLNSMYEDDVKLRDMLSLGLWENMQPAGTPCIRMRYTELYIDGVYWGLYGFQQVVSARVLSLKAEDGLTKIVSDFNSSVIAKRSVWATEIIQPLSDQNVSYLLLDALALLAEKDPSALGRFDRETLFRYALFIQFICGTDSTLKNIVSTYLSQSGLLRLSAYDTDQSFGLMWDNNCPPLYMGVHPELSSSNFLKGSYSPWSGLVSDELGVRYGLAQLWFTLREGALSEEQLLTDARTLFSLVTESGAREREHFRWPGGNYAASPKQIETFITERLVWCDIFFNSYLGING